VAFCGGVFFGSFWFCCGGCRIVLGLVVRWWFWLLVCLFFDLILCVVRVDWGLAVLFFCFFGGVVLWVLVFCFFGVARVLGVWIFVGVAMGCVVLLVFCLVFFGVFGFLFFVFVFFVVFLGCGGVRGLLVLVFFGFLCFFCGGFPLFCGLFSVDGGCVCVSCVGLVFVVCGGGLGVL